MVRSSHLFLPLPEIIAIHSALKMMPALPALVILGDLTIGENLKEGRSVAEPLRSIMDNALAAR